jgi:hypothetical protein
VNRKLLWLFPLAAAAVGDRVEVPARKPALPSLELKGCSYGAALANYLEAYAYLQEDRNRSLQLAEAAEEELRPCQGDASVLAQRIRALKSVLSP